MYVRKKWHWKNEVMVQSEQGSYQSTGNANAMCQVLASMTMVRIDLFLSFSGCCVLIQVSAVFLSRNDLK